MKILEISDTGIVLKDKNEILAQELYSDEEDILFEIYNMLSKQEEIGEIKICILTKIKDETKNSIEEIIKEKNGIVLKDRKNNIKKIYKIVSIVIVFELIIFLILYIIFMKKEKEIDELKKKRLEIKEIEEKNRQEIKELETVEEKKVLIKKDSIYPEIRNIISFFGEDIYIEKLQIKEKNIEITAYGKNLKKIIQVKKKLEKSTQSDSIKFDFIKKEGEEMRFLIEIKLK